MGDGSKGSEKNLVIDSPMDTHTGRSLQNLTVLGQASEATKLSSLSHRSFPREN